jgi:hypothetical protein
MPYGTLGRWLAVRGSWPTRGLKHDPALTLLGQIVTACSARQATRPVSSRVKAKTSIVWQVSEGRFVQVAQSRWSPAATRRSRTVEPFRSGDASEAFALARDGAASLT